MSKSETAFRTIGELSTELGIAPHILRYWETRFPQLKPLQRSGNRRYYRPEDVALVRRIDSLLNRDGYTIKGVQKLLAARGTKADQRPPAAPAGDEPEPPPPSADLPLFAPVDRFILVELAAVRNALAKAVAES